MNVVNRPPPSDAYTFIAGKPTVAVAIHNTVGFDGIRPKRGASWHWLIARDGTCYRDVPEAYCAHHVLSTDEWRPPWVVRAPNGLVSDVNWCALGIELVSTNGSLVFAWDGYTDAQYTAFRELAADIVSRHGPIPFVGHGQLQLDRVDPVAFDYTRAGLGPMTAHGRYFQGVDDVTEAQQRILDSAVKWGIDDGGELDFLMGTRKTLAEQVASLEQLKNAAQAERDAYMAEAQRLKEALQNATQPIATRITRVQITATLEGGSTQELEAVAT